MKRGTFENLNYALPFLPHFLTNYSNCLEIDQDWLQANNFDVWRRLAPACSSQVGDGWLDHPVSLRDLTIFWWWRSCRHAPGCHYRARVMFSWQTQGSRDACHEIMTTVWVCRRGEWSVSVTCFLLQNWRSCMNLNVKLPFFFNTSTKYEPLAWWHNTSCWQPGMWQRGSCYGQVMSVLSCPTMTHPNTNLTPRLTFHYQPIRSKYCVTRSFSANKKPVLCHVIPVSQ